MSSWQSKLFKLIFRIRRWRNQPDRTDIVQSRANLEAMATRFAPPPELQTESLTVAGLPAEWVFSPGAINERVVLYLHGGGYTIGSLNTHRTLAGNIARAAQARALVIEYRLAPEHLFPAAVEDTIAAYRWLLAHNFDPAQIAIGGDSSGGGLALAALVALRDAGDPLPATAVCLSAWTDLAGTGESLVTRAKADPWLRPEGVVPMAQLYLGDTDPYTPLASPLYADLTGLPPMLLQVGTAEIMLSDSTRLAERAQAAGVDVTLETWDGMIHVFQAFSGRIPEAQQAIERIGAFIRQHIQPPGG